MIEEMELGFQFELVRLSTISKLSPELGEAARGALETERAAYLARIDDVFAGHAAAKRTYIEAVNGAEGAVTAICASRCAATKEVAIKLRYLMSGPVEDDIESGAIEALLASFLPEGEEIAAI